MKGLAPNMRRSTRQDAQQRRLADAVRLDHEAQRAVLGHQLGPIDCNHFFYSTNRSESNQCTNLEPAHPPAMDPKIAASIVQTISLITDPLPMLTNSADINILMPRTSIIPSTLPIILPRLNVFHPIRVTQ